MSTEREKYEQEIKKNKKKSTEREKYEQEIKKNKKKKKRNAIVGAILTGATIVLSIIGKKANNKS